MTDYTLTEYDKILLTDILGEEWLSKTERHVEDCKECGRTIIFKENREFDTDQDRTDLFRKLWELGQWLDFKEFAILNRWEESPKSVKEGQDWSAWLFIDNPLRACKLVAEFWKTERRKRMLERTDCVYYQTCTLRRGGVRQSDYTFSCPCTLFTEYEPVSTTDNTIDRRKAQRRK